MRSLKRHTRNMKYNTKISFFAFHFFSTYSQKNYFLNYLSIDIYRNVYETQGFKLLDLVFSKCHCENERTFVYDVIVHAHYSSFADSRMILHPRF